MRTLGETRIRKLAGALLFGLALTLLAATVVSAKDEAGKVGEVSAKETKGEEMRTFGSILNDRWIARTIKSAYMFNNQINSFDVGPEVKRGVVTVIGYVTDVSTRDKALSIARETAGVKEVVDKLIVDSDYRAKLARGELLDQESHDKWVSLNVRKRLLNDKEVTGTWLGVKAEDGHVTLKGTVYKWGEINKAEEIASGVEGVKEVNNKLVCCRM